MEVAPIPRISSELLDEHEAAHVALAETYRSSDHVVQLLFTLLQRRLVIESLAYLQSVLVRDDDQLLFPPPRGFLTKAAQLRIRGASAAFRHVDTRVTLVQQGLVAHEIDASTPQALHALLEGGNPGDHETNPGLLRCTPTSWQPDVSRFVHPDHTEVPQMLAAAIEGTRDASVPPPVRAAWLTFACMTIHPFVDGNGRTARSLYLAMASPSLPLGIDWGITEQWSVSRRSYIAALQAGHSIDRYDAKRLDAAPFTEFSTAASIRGASLCSARIVEIGQRAEHRRALGLTDDELVVLGTIEMLRSATWDELRSTMFTTERLDATVSELLGRGAIEWRPRPFGRRTMDDPADHALVTTF